MGVARTDGGAELEDGCQKNGNRPDLVLILDGYQAARDLEKRAQRLPPQAEPASPPQAEQGCGLLKAAGGAPAMGLTDAEVGRVAGPVEGGAGVHRQARASAGRPGGAGLGLAASGGHLFAQALTDWSISLRAGMTTRISTSLSACGMP